MSGKPAAVVTGGAGFIGSHMVDVAAGRGHYASASSTISPAATAATSIIIKGNPDLACYWQDIRTLEPDSPIFAGAQYVFHFAGIGDIVPSIEQPTRVHGHQRPGHRARARMRAPRAASKKFVYAASSSCYGLAAVPTGEDHPIDPQYPYALSKYQGEQAAFHWHRVYGLPVNSICIFNAYGPRVRTTGAYGAVFGVFFRQKLAGKPYTVVGDGTQRRDFIYVTDVAEAFLAAAADRSAASASMSAPAIRSRSTGWSSCSAATVVYVPKRPGEPDCTLADISKIDRGSAGSRRSTSRTACARMLATSSAGAMRRCGTPIDRGGDQDLVPLSRRAGGLRPCRCWLLDRLSPQDQDGGGTARDHRTAPARESASSCATACSTSCIPATSATCSMPRARPTS